MMTEHGFIDIEKIEEYLDLCDKEDLMMIGSKNDCFKLNIKDNRFTCYIGDGSLPENFFFFIPRRRIVDDFKKDGFDFEQFLLEQKDGK